MRSLSMHNTDTSPAIFDPTLTPQNAAEKGYDYIDDVIYDQLNPSESKLDILEFIKKFHCKLGTPCATSDKFLGLYMQGHEFFKYNAS